MTNEEREVKRAEMRLACEEARKIVAAMPWWERDTLRQSGMPFLDKQSPVVTNETT